MQKYITVFVNGEPFNCKQTMCLQDLLLYLNFNLSAIVVEYNKEIISMSRFCNIFLRMNDLVEVITIVGGG